MEKRILDVLLPRIRFICGIYFSLGTGCLGGKEGDKKRDHNDYPQSFHVSNYYIPPRSEESRMKRGRSTLIEPPGTSRGFLAAAYAIINGPPEE